MRITRILALLIAAPVFGQYQVRLVPLPTAGTGGIYMDYIAYDPGTGFVWAPAGWLVDQGVQEWMELPLWIADPDFAGHSRVDNSRARAAGLRFRSLETTIADTLSWVESGAAPPDPPAGLAREREQELLALLATAVEDRL